MENLSDFHCFWSQQLPIPGSMAKAVTYPMCEWRASGFPAEATHPLNRFVCNWLASDMTDVARCDEVLDVMTQLQNGHCKSWFVDGDGFNVDMHTSFVQFNLSHVGPEDLTCWNQLEGQFKLNEVQRLLRVWRDFLNQRS